jgi:photosystem II stability/assembly factor-like uncharacterized protein
MYSPNFLTGAVVMAHRVIGLVVISLLISMFAVSCQSAQPAPPGGSAAGQTGPAMSLAVDATDGSLLKAAGGLFHSTNRGQTWQPLPIPASLHPDTLRTVATTSAAPSSVYAAGPGAGVVRSEDRGQTWRTVSVGLPSQDVTAFAVHSFRPDTFYAGIEGQGVFRTEDGGDRWQKMDVGPQGAVIALAHSTLEGSMNTGWLYAATPAGPYLSMDCF